MSQLLARLCAAVVGMVFAVAAASKLLDRGGWMSSARRQGVPDIVAVAIPPLELALGVALVAAPVTPALLGVATVLLLVFTVFIAVSLATGRRAPCACFGARARRNLSARDLARNAVLIGLLACAAALA